jgi:uncharacterized protein
MQYRKFGQIDWEASVLGFGCMRFPTIGEDSGKIDQEKTNAMIWRAIEGGVNYFDTAYVYHKQQSEVALGIALANGFRHKVRIATKLPIWLVNEADDFDRMVDEELGRLQTDVIDFYLMHALDAGSWEKVQKLGLLKKAERAIADGRIRHIGFSFHDSLPVFKQIVDGYDHWDFCQIQYNYMDIDYQAGKKGLQYAADEGLAVVIMEPLRGGKLAADIPAAKPLWDQADKQRTPADWALQWLWSQPEVTLILSGMSTLEQVEENVASAAQSRVGVLDKGEIALVEKVRETLDGLSPIDCTQCEYCLPCPQGVNIPRVFDYYNRIAVYDDLEGTRDAYQRFFEEEQKAAHCIQCDECVPKCPQNIPISEWMPIIEDVLSHQHPYQNKIG